MIHNMLSTEKGYTHIINGSTPAISLHNGSDVNGDGRIGLEEAVYALQIVSEQR